MDRGRHRVARGGRVGDLGKPTPAANNDITVNRAAFFAALPAGNYIGTVTAIGPGGQTPSTSVPFVR